VGEHVNPNGKQGRHLVGLAVEGVWSPTKGQHAPPGGPEKGGGLVRGDVSELPGGDALPDGINEAFVLISDPGGQR
jgi:hypothetical protein